MKETLMVGLVLCLLSLIAAGAAIVLADFGAPAWVFVLLLSWLLTFGLPTLCAILVLVHFWEGLALQGFLVSSVLLALFFQCAAVGLFRWGIGRLRAGKAT